MGLDLLTRVTLPPLWIADQVRNDGVVGLSCSPSPLIPLPSRERGTEVVLSFMFGHGQVMVL